MDRQRPAAGRGDRAGTALGVVLGAAVTWNLAANLWLPWALYVPGGLLLAAILVGVAVKIGGCRWSDLGLDRHELRRGLGYGAVVALLVAVVLALGAALPATRGLFQDRRAADISTAVLLYVALVRVPFGTVVLEETLFRGVLLGLGLRRWSHMTAVNVSCLAFGLWHVLPARHVTSFNPVFADLAAGTWAECTAWSAPWPGRLWLGWCCAGCGCAPAACSHRRSCMPPSTGLAMGSPSSPGALPDRQVRRHQLGAATRLFLCSEAAGSITGPGSLPIPEPQEGLMAEEPTAPTPLDAIDLQSLSDEELQRLIQLLMRERERRMGLEPGPEDSE